MGNIIHKMGYQVPKTLFWFNIFLATYLAKSAFYDGPAV